MQVANKFQNANIYYTTGYNLRKGSFYLEALEMFLKAHKLGIKE